MVYNYDAKDAKKQVGDGQVKKKQIGDGPHPRMLKDSQDYEPVSSNSQQEDDAVKHVNCRVISIVIYLDFNLVL